jgi:GR25 family glycosyltransferase involved in LPS biosynthesis
MLTYYIIHCKEHIERDDWVASISQTLGQPTTIFDGYYTKDVLLDKQLEYLQSVNSALHFTSNWQFNTPGQIGCYLSHYKLIEHIKNSGSEGYSVIFEDDIKVDPTTHQRIMKVIQTVEKNNIDFDIIKLGHTGETPVDKITDTIYAISNGNPCFGTWALLINNNHAAKIFANIHTIIHEIDSQYTRCDWAGTLRVLLVKPVICSPNWTLKSNIRLPTS